MKLFDAVCCPNADKVLLQNAQSEIKCIFIALHSYLATPANFTIMLYKRPHSL